MARDDHMDSWRIVCENERSLHDLLTKNRASRPTDATITNYVNKISYWCRREPRQPKQADCVSILLHLLETWDAPDREGWLYAISAYCRERGIKDPIVKVHDSVCYDLETLPIDELTRKLKRIASPAELVAAYGGSVTGRMSSSAPNYQELPKEPKMTKPIKIETKHYVNGIDVTTLKDADVWNIIAEQEQTVAKLKEIKAQPASLIAHIAEVEAGIAALVAFVDERTKKVAA